MRGYGFTLKQLLVVLVIIAALAALLFPVVQIVRYRVLEAKCRANLWTIYMKYKLIRMQNNDRWDEEAIKEFRMWRLSPEGLKVIKCPLSGEYYGIIANDHDPRKPYLIGGDEIALYMRDNLVAMCYCHTRPPRPRCGVPYVGGACVLMVLDIGDGNIEYGFDFYTKDQRTQKIIWPREGEKCPDPRWFPDVSKGY
ncbi:hypothetical protein HRbin15_00838 [bacterium HR15]|nr:hypothetical protein HRbin15_00838 [bacterium HR15]